MAVTIKAVNKALAAREETAGVELVRAPGYFYFVGEPVCFAATTSVMVPRVGDLSVAEWVSEAVSFVARSAARQGPCSSCSRELCSGEMEYSCEVCGRECCTACSDTCGDKNVVCDACIEAGYEDGYRQSRDS